MEPPSLRALRTACLVMLGAAEATLAAKGTVTIPYLTGRPGVKPFAGHPGWVDLFHKGKPTGASARIGPDGTFELPDPVASGTLVVTFDQFEAIPFVIPNWPMQPGNCDAAVPVEYACVPPGYPQMWDKEYVRRNHHWFQTFVPRGTQIYGCTVFDGPKAISWGNKFNATLHEDGPDG